jgi:hypothetical protein
VEHAGDVSPLLDQAQLIGMPGADKDDAPERGSTNEPTTGSFERFLTSFGSPARWAGH